MQKFIKKNTIFLIPIGLVFIFPITVFIISREYYSAKDSVENQILHTEAIFEPSYVNLNKTYKKLLVDSINPDILVLGTSRSGQYRKDFFSNNIVFANASNVIDSIAEMEKFVKELSTKSRVKLMIIGLDQDIFFIDTPKPDEVSVLERWRTLLVSNWHKVYEDYYYEKFSIKNLYKQSKETSNIGMNALINGRGFRGDGSFRDGKKLNALNRESLLSIDISNELSAIKADRGSFLYGKEIRRSDLDTLRRILKLCKERSIYVVGFMPPYPHAFYEAMSHVDDIYKKQVFGLPNTVQNIFGEFDFGFFDFSDIKMLGASDVEFSDIKHGTDKLYLRMIIYMAERDSKLGEYTDLSKLKKMLEDSENVFLKNQ